AAGRLDEAIAALTALTAQDPDDHSALLDLADALARAGRIDEAEAALARLPVSVASEKAADQVRARLRFLRDAAGADEVEALRAQGDASSPRDQYRLAAYDLVHGEVVSGLEGLLALMQRHRKFEEGLAQRALLQAFALLGHEDERVATYRRRMAGLLY
ncbi:MAG TPA: tetratricopeptide repeat protein, partial [Steroidobacteraceae bacterium]|nr:tetratricopeptide repeat protein [Steroidobacteraceae bacterium]